MVHPPSYQLKITLRDVRPPVWRRLCVPAQLPLPFLHEVFQAAMRWTDSHLHLFRVRDEVWAPLNDEWEPLGSDSEGVLLSELAPGKGSRFVYEYDFGDGWTHDVVVEAVRDDVAPGLVCLAGKRACPPEDCGGPWGYQELLAILADPAHEEHEERKEWCGEHDPEEFEVERVNEMLAGIWSHARARKGRRRGGKASGRRTREQLLDDFFGTDDLGAAP